MTIARSTPSGRHASGSGVFFSEMARLAVIAASYFIATQAGLYCVVQPEGLASVWPSSGVALAALILTERRKWLPVLLVIFATNIAGNFFGGNTLPASLGFALANSAESALSAWMILHICGPEITFARLIEVIALFGVSVASNGFTALIGASVPALAFGAPYFDTWLTWWVADGLGILLITPVIVSWATRPIQTPSWKKIAEGGILLALISSLALLFFNPATSTAIPVIDVYLIFPLLIWAALRFDLRFTATLIFVFSTIAVWLSVHGFNGPDAVNPQLKNHLFFVQLLVGIATFSALILSAAITEQRRSKGEKESLIQQLQSALQEVKTLRGIIPICCYCKQIRNDKGSWSQVEEYIHEHSEATFSHGICPDCYKIELEKLDKEDS